ncbi:hypothetical protein [Mycobacterium interjectum]|uniref:hypothetical protein n=1 Tax=Mycobacterium interjectum TaxID=33895 RepID=UPI000A871A02|nr:hypothetical protein [Mycobacterium interjectum]
MFPSRAAETLTRGPVPDAFLCAVLANRQLRPKHQFDLERIAEIRDLWFFSC